MVDYRRQCAAGASYFVTVNLEDRGRALLTEHIDALREVVRRVRESHPFAIDAMVVLPDHFHAVWTLPTGDAQLSRRLQLVKAFFTRRLAQARVAIGRDARGEYRLWQKRFREHVIGDAHDYRAHFDYVHINPVRHGHARVASAWPYSTIHRYVARGVLPSDWGCALREGDCGE